MRNLMKPMRKGFTLIELLVVILILAILAALIVPRIVGRTDDAKIAKAKSDISELSSMLQAYRLDTGQYPTTEEGLNALRVPPTDVTGYKGPYSEKDIPLDPWNHPYVYEYPGPSGDSPLIESYGADGAPGGTGTATDITNQTDNTQQ